MPLARRAAARADQRRSAFPAAGDETILGVDRTGAKVERAEPKHPEKKELCRRPASTRTERRAGRSAVALERGIADMVLRVGSAGLHAMRAYANAACVKRLPAL